VAGVRWQPLQRIERGVEVAQLGADAGYVVLPQDVVRTDRQPRDSHCVARSRSPRFTTHPLRRDAGSGSSVNSRSARSKASRAPASTSPSPPDRPADHGVRVAVSDGRHICLDQPSSFKGLYLLSVRERGSRTARLRH
jgi:hypothetical protein